MNENSLIRLADVVTIVAKQVSPTQSEFASLPHVSAENIESGTQKLFEVRSAHEDGVFSGKYLFEPGDILYSKLRPYLRKVAIAPFRGLCSADMYPLRTNAAIADPNYLSWLLLTKEFTDYANTESQRARMPKLNREQLFAWRFHLPAIHEQRRLAVQLREQFAEVERARAAVAQQLQAAEALPAAILRTVFSSPAAARWHCQKLIEVADISAGVALGRKMPGHGVRQVPYLRVANVKDGRLDLSEIKETPATESEIADCRLQFGDVLLTEGGDPDKLGRGTFWQNQLPECILQNHVFRVRFETNADPAFMAYQFGSEYGKAYFFRHAKQTTGIATINRTVLGNFPLMLPPPDEQRTIAARINAEFEQAQSLREHLSQKLAAVEKLPAALLREAFGGTDDSA